MLNETRHRGDLPHLYFAALTRLGANSVHDVFAGGPTDHAAPLSGPLRFILTNNQVAQLTIDVDPATATVTTQAAPEALHYFRLADATLKPLPPEPAPLTLARGDAYIALSPGVRAVADSPAVARFLHLRDYFNASRLAQATLDHLVGALTTPPPEDITVVVIEAR